ncbi:hypothetical protein [Cryptosporangium aurantiacum]|uniref:Uncharacterized protein n=1 Tax=Cryptosporangium aurantiacum TaxID=134849 RepID=A0A1M7RMN5_9ACTN|nr:hypothetical protein [Cryptosporangium aurantiacum]SHN47459.1 hypothetical protein SAMN05443668_12415 [Cryptosporangium aurantiacum]
MVEVDVFWAYGIGAGFALAAAAQLRAGAVLSEQPAAARGTASESKTGSPTAEKPVADPYLLITALYCAALFAPSGAWLLWGFPSWETMHVGDYDTIPAWLVALFAATNTTQGVLGYLVTRWLLRAGRPQLAAFQVVAAYFGMFFILVHGWDGTGYERFFSETRADFEAWDTRPVLTQVGDWVGSDVALTLYGMGVVLLPVMFWLWMRWHRAGRRLLGQPAGAAQAWAFFGTAHGLIWLGGLGGAIVASVLIHLLGWWIGGALAIALGVVLFRPARGPLGRSVRWLVPDAGQATVTAPLVDPSADPLAGTRTR